MIYLIGGSPRCGKTILSKKLALKKKVSFVSTDAFRAMILATVPKDEVKNKFPQVEMKTPKDKFKFNVYSSQEMLKAQKVEARSMWPPIKAFITSLIYREQDFVIEGVHLFPELVQKLRKTEYWEHVRIVYLVKTDLEKIKKGFAKNKSGFDWMYPAIKGDEERLDKAAKMVEVKSQYIEKGAAKYNFKLFNTEDDFTKTIMEALNYLDQ